MSEDWTQSLIYTGQTLTYKLCQSRVASSILFHDHLFLMPINVIAFLCIHGFLAHFFLRTDIIWECPLVFLHDCQCSTQKWVCVCVCYHEIFVYFYDPFWSSNTASNYKSSNWTSSLDTGVVNFCLSLWCQWVRELESLVE